MNVEKSKFEPDSVGHAAAGWSERLRESDHAPEVEQAFEAWCALDVAHAQAFERVESARLRIIALAESPELLALRSETLSRVAVQQPRWPRNVSALAASVAVFVAVVATFTGGPWRELPSNVYDRVRAVVRGETIYETAIGERLAFTLEDDSVITLNTGSRVVVTYRDESRSVRLERGQALFEVAKDPSRPFVVSASDRRVTALGTQFDVKLLDQMFEVTLLEGRIIVEPQPAVSGVSSAASPVADAQRAVLAPGQQLIAAVAKTPIVRKVDIKRVVSWREGRVIFEDDDLSSVIHEMNRYSRRQLVLADNQLASLRISGAFDTGRTSVFVDALTAYFPIVVKQQSAEQIVLAWRE